MHLRRDRLLSVHGTWLIAITAIVAVACILAAVAFEEGVRVGFEQAHQNPRQRQQSLHSPLPRPMSRPADN